MLFRGQTNEFLQIETICSSNKPILKGFDESTLTILWFQDDASILLIDNITYHFKKNQLIFLTEFHQIEVKEIGNIKMVRFNRAFYCILDHDSEVSCKGILFFGASSLPLISMQKEDREQFSNLIKVFEDEMASKDALQLEMLQMLLKRFLILCTRIYKEQNHLLNLPTDNVDLIREFNFLVEKHFKTTHNVSGYAELLFKSPKTLSNVFAKLGNKSPLQYIQDRIMLEARRLLRYSDSSVKEIAYELGYEDLQAFSRFFKKNEGIAPSEFKKKFF